MFKDHYGLIGMFITSIIGGVAVLFFLASEVILYFKKYEK